MLSEAVARKPVIETLLTGDCSPTARMWTPLVENRYSDDLENVSMIEPEGGDEIHIGKIDCKVSPAKPRARDRVARRFYAKVPAVKPHATIQSLSANRLKKAA